MYFWSLTPDLAAILRHTGILVGEHWGGRRITYVPSASSPEIYLISRKSRINFSDVWGLGAIATKTMVHFQATEACQWLSSMKAVSCSVFQDWSHSLAMILNYLSNNNKKIIIAEMHLILHSKKCWNTWSRVIPIPSPLIARSKPILPYDSRFHSSF